MLKKYSALVGGLVLAQQSLAVEFADDVGLVAQFTDTTSDITAVGALILGLAVLAMGIRWVNAMFF